MGLDPGFGRGAVRRPQCGGSPCAASPDECSVMNRHDRTGGIASVIAQQQFRACVRRVEHGTLPLEEAMALARGLAPIVLREVVAAERLARGRTRPDNLRQLRGYLHRVEHQGRQRRRLAARKRLDQALEALRDGTHPADPAGWVQQFRDLDDETLGELVRYAVQKTRHESARPWTARELGRRQAIARLVEVAGRILQLERPLARRPASRMPQQDGPAQLRLPFGPSLTAGPTVARDDRSCG